MDVDVERRARSIGRRVGDRCFGGVGHGVVIGRWVFRKGKKEGTCIEDVVGRGGDQL